MLLIKLALSYTTIMPHLSESYLEIRKELRGNTQMTRFMGMISAQWFVMGAPGVEASALKRTINDYLELIGHERGAHLHTVEGEHSNGTDSNYIRNVDRKP